MLSLEQYALLEAFQKKLGDEARQSLDKAKKYPDCSAGEMYLGVSMVLNSISSACLAVMGEVIRQQTEHLDA